MPHSPCIKVVASRCCCWCCTPCLLGALRPRCSGSSTRCHGCRAAAAPPYTRRRGRSLPQRPRPRENVLVQGGVFPGGDGVSYRVAEDGVHRLGLRPWLWFGHVGRLGLQPGLAALGSAQVASVVCEVELGWEARSRSGRCHDASGAQECSGPGRAGRHVRRAVVVVQS